MRKFLSVFILCLLLCDAAYTQRKKIGLVLSGGGAKGVAHIGVLKVLEEAGIPIDYIAGTSMGAIVGGLYSIGYNARDLDSLVKIQDWVHLLSDKVYRYNLPFSEKEENEKYLVSLPLVEGHRLKVPVGFINGQNIYNLFSELTIGYHDSLSFMDLPIPFSCVAADLTDGKQVIMNNGNLALAMRASMAIPGAFEPVRLNNMVLVDGGISNNFPVDVVRAMGAEIVIGVDLSTGLKNMEGLNSMIGVVEQLTTLIGITSYEKNKKEVDLYMNPGLVGFTVASFTKEAVDTMILRGEQVARFKWDELMKLKKAINLDENKVDVTHHKVKRTDSIPIRYIYIEGVPMQNENWIRRRIKLRDSSVISREDLHRATSILYGMGTFANVSYKLSGEPVYDLTFILEEKVVSSINFGFRFDSEEMASILLNSTVCHNALRGSRLSLTGRLSRNPYARIGLSFGNNFFQRINLSYMYRYNDINLYNHGDKVDNLVFSYHLGELSFSDINFMNYKFQMGMRYEHFKYESNLYDTEYKVSSPRSENFFSYYALAHYETFDRKYYPEKGYAFKAEYSLYTDDLTHYNDGVPFSSVAFSFESATRLTRRVYLIPALYGRILIGKNIPPPYQNYMGGEVPERYFSRQLPFTGIRDVEIFDNALMVSKLTLRYRLGARHYVTLVGNYAKQNDSFWDILKGDDIWGGGIGYSYNSILGPIGAIFDISNWDGKVGFYFNLGYYF